MSATASTSPSTSTIVVPVAVDIAVDHGVDDIVDVEENQENAEEQAEKQNEKNREQKNEKTDIPFRFSVSCVRFSVPSFRSELPFSARVCIFSFSVLQSEERNPVSGFRFSVFASGRQL